MPGFSFRADSETENTGVSRMKKICVFCVLFLALFCVAAESIYNTGKAVAVRSPFDRALESEWRKAGLSEVLEASDCVLVRRVYLDLAGRLPTPEEAKRYVSSKDPRKYEALVETLLKDPGFVALWSMRFGDMLRVKSEFPINLWPNAVYVYMRRIREFLGKDESYADFVRALLLSGGSNFREPCVNFYRAHADRSPRGIAQDTLRTLCGLELNTLPEADQAAWIRIFDEVAFKSTKEWKEEIVYFKCLPEREIFLPSGAPRAIPADGQTPEKGTPVVPGIRRTIPAGGEARTALADHLSSGEGRRLLARNLADRTWQWVFGSSLCRADAPGTAELLDLLSDDFMEHGFKFRRLCRMIVLSAAYRSASIQPDAAAKQACFAAYPVRRLEAEVLDDAIRDLTGVPRRYSSVIPEPFTFIPQEMRTVEIEDGSISSSFLILFGRPSRDAGTPDERSDEITAKQRLYLFNSAELYRRLQKIPRHPDFRKQSSLAQRIDWCYWLFYSRPATEAEQKILRERCKAMSPKSRWKFFIDLQWTLVNSPEFLYRH